MMRIRLMVLASGLLGMALLTASAQVPVSGVKLAAPVAAPEGGKLAPTEGGGSAEALPTPREFTPDGKLAKAPPKENVKLTKLKQLNFDRKPSNILKVWNEVNSPPRKDPEPKAEGKEGKEGKEGEKAKAAPKVDPVDQELKQFQSDVILGKWDRVKLFLKGFSPPEDDQAYLSLLAALQRYTPPGAQAMNPGMDPQEMMQMQMEMQQRQQIPPNLLEQASFSLEDVLGIADAAPGKIEERHLKILGNLLSKSITSGRSVIEEVVRRFESLAQKPDSSLKRRQFAQLLILANQAAYADRFLPKLAEAKAQKDGEALDLLAQHYLLRETLERKAIDLEQAWLATQEVLGLPETKREIFEECLKRAVTLAPRVKETLGQAWLEESFRKQIDRGREILAALGARTSAGLSVSPMQPAVRLGELKLQKLAVESLIKAAPERAREWQSPITLLAQAWLREAECSRQFDRSQSLGPRMQFDPFGNVFYANDDEEMSPYQRFMPQQGFQAIRIGELLDAMPGAGWVEALEPGFRPRLTQGVAQLLLKVKEDVKAFPYIESLAKDHPEKARVLVNEFLKVWTRNHNLNSDRQTRNPFVFYYGFERRQEGIPITRSKQERNLVELAEWVARLKKLPVGEIDQELLAKAFTSCHSSAEVYRLEAIESVFGPLASIKPRTLAGLLQQMRENLAGVWRDPAAQEEKKTNRKQKDIQQEVQRGYRLALAVTDGALKQFPNEWALTLAKAALLHDELNYQAELAKSTDFAPRRDESMTLFAKAAQQYQGAVQALPEEEQSLLPFEQWYCAALGAVDTRFIDEEKLVDARQPAKIRAALASLPGELAEKHRGRFANGLFTKMSAVKPAAKFRYLKAGFEIVGDHKAAWEARKLYEYYKDLVTEIKLDAAVDGPTKVGHGEPFGVFVSIRHTREIERESGGFGKYLQNQNSGRGYFYNYGRPTADYRDRFQTAVKDALKEQFEIVSVTFQDEKVNSRATPEYGWRFTPYAYLLLKPRGPQVDRIAPIRMDFDFLDTSGYVVLPVETPVVPIDCGPKQGSPRPVRNLQVTQILDERQAAQGKLIVEVKASGVGLVGDLESLLDLSPEGFERTQVLPQATSVVRFDPEAPLAIHSERSWLVHFTAREGTNPQSFRFGTARTPEVELTLQRYEDADLVNAQPEVQLLASYRKAGKYGWVGWVVGGAICFGLALLIVRMVRHAATPERPLELPENLDVFRVLGLLQRVRNEKGLNELQRSEIGQTIQTLERNHFAPTANGAMPPEELRRIAERWLR